MSATSSGHGGEALFAARNAVTLALSLGVTGGIALAMRLAVPRLLGPEAFGEYRLAEASAELLFVVLTFGVDALLRRQAAIDPARARGALMGLAALRVVAGVACAAVLARVLDATGAHNGVVILFWVMAVAQVLTSINNTYTAIEHAAGDVRWIARTNVGMKLLWAMAMGAILLAGPSAMLLVLATVAVEILRLTWLATRGSAPASVPGWAEVRGAVAMLVDSLPFFVNLVAHSFYARVGVAWLAAYGSRADLGLFGAAGNLASIALLGMPLISWVLVPSAARAGVRSEAEVSHLVSSTLRVALLVVAPMGLATFAAAELWLVLFFGQAFADAAPILRILAPTFVLAYASTVCAVALIQRGRAWTVAGISISGVVVTLALDALLVPWGVRALGPGGGAQAAAWATLGTEVLVTIALVAGSWRELASPALGATAAALSAAAAVTALFVHWAPVSGMALALSTTALFVTVLVAAGGITTSDLAFGRRVAGARGVVATGTPVEVS